MNRLKKTDILPLHFLLVPVFFIIHNYTDFFGIIDFSTLYFQIISWLLAPVCIYFVLIRWFKNKWPAALYTTLLISIYFFLSLFLHGLKQVPLLSHIARYSVLIPIILAILIYLFFFIKKRNQNFQRLHAYLFFTFFSLILFDSISFIIKGKKTVLQANSFKTEAVPQLITDENDSDRPDIFYLIFDEHPSTASVKRLTGYDNSLLDSGLKRSGFRVAPFATSGFSQTAPALCSVFDMGAYPYNAQYKASFKELYQAKQLLQNNQLFPFLKNEGYSIINASIFNFKDHPGIVTPKKWWGQPADMITNQTFFNRMNEDIGWIKALYFPSFFKNPIEESIKADVLITNAALKKIDSALLLPDTIQKFVFGHFFLPHDPYKFDSTGKIYKGSFKQYLLSGNSDTPYVHQIVYTRRFILTLAEKIKKENKRPALIIIQGDHGKRVYNAAKGTSDEPFNILCAFYFPGENAPAIGDDFFAPNTFRVILNRYFGNQLVLQKEWHKNLKLE